MPLSIQTDINIVEITTLVHLRYFLAGNCPNKTNHYIKLR